MEDLRFATADALGEERTDDGRPVRLPPGGGGAYSPFRDLEAQIQQLTMNAWGAPQWILSAHAANEVSNLSAANSYSRGDREFEKATAMLFPSEIAQRGRMRDHTAAPFRRRVTV